MARLLLTAVMLMVALGGGVDRKALGGEKADESCTVTSFSYAQLCTQPLKSQAKPPALLDRLGRRQPCRDVVLDDRPLTKLEVTVDRQGRLVRARLLEPSGRCATKCLEHTFRLGFLPVAAGGIATMETTTIVCRPTSAGEGRAAEQGDEGADQP